MLHPENLHAYQRDAHLHQLYYPHSMMWLQMGLGKTIVTLSSVVALMRAGEVKKTLIWGPLRVVKTVWEREARKWSHTDHLRFSVMHGTKDQRTRALFADADIYLCNYESMNWLAQTLDHYYLSQGLELPFQFCVYDEITMVKNSTSKRVAGGNRIRKDNHGNEYKIKLTGWRKFIDKFPYTTGLTGSPASNGYLDLFGQYLVVDGGERLGTHLTHFRDSYFTSDYMGWSYTPTEIGKTMIEQKISDITKRMDSRDYLDLPPVTVTNVMVDLPDAARKAYNDLEAKLFAELDSGNKIELLNKTSIGNKCLQICNGSPYISNPVTGELTDDHDALHDAKLDALEEVLEEAGGRPVLCGYSFVSDAKRIMARFKKYKPVNLTDEASSRTGRIIDDWNSGKIKLLIGHPKSMGHGLDGLQESGSILVLFGLPWSREQYDQLIARLDRQGQLSPVSVIRILCNETIDLAVADSLERKFDTEVSLKDAIDRYRSGLVTNSLEVNFW